MATRVRNMSAALLVMTALVAASLATTAQTAWAGGSHMYSVADRYEPGEVATMVAYINRSGTLGSIDDGPFFAYLRTTPYSNGDTSSYLEMAPFTPRPTDLPLGPIDITHFDRPGYLEYRLAFHFTVPEWLRPGAYAVMYCNAGCSKGVSDLMGGSIFVGVDPPYAYTRDWPPDEPEWANVRRAVPYSPLEPAIGARSTPHVAGTVRSAKHLQRRLSSVTEVARTGTTLCARNTAVHVYEFETAAARRHATVDVRRNQASVPNYFARGKVIAVVRGNDARLLDEVAAIMGPTITPNAAEPTELEACT